MQSALATRSPAPNRIHDQSCSRCCKMLGSTIMAAPLRAAWHLGGPRPRDRINLQICAAKKGGKKGGGGKEKKGSSIPQSGAPRPAPWRDPTVIMHNLLLIESFSRQVGRPIMEDIELSEAARALFEAPFGVLAHEFHGDGPPTFVYANQVALDLFETTWADLIGQPSSVSADDVAEIQEERAAMLAEAQKRGFVADYSGWRRSLKGTRFKLIDVLLWNVISPGSEDVLGQAVLIEEWEFEDGRRAGPRAVPLPPTADEVTAAEVAVIEQAEVVRELKEGQGLGNKDAPVAAAVEELLQRKERVLALKAAVAAAAEAEAAVAQA